MLQQQQKSTLKTHIFFETPGTLFVTVNKKMGVSNNVKALPYT